MIKVVSGNLFDSKSQVWVNTVNTVGVMGKGIALEFKNRFPEMFEEYTYACKYGYVRIGTIWIWELPKTNIPQYVFNFPTKAHWRKSSRIEWIERGLDDLEIQLKIRSIKSISIPPLGCGNGGLDWEKVRPLIEEKLGGLDCEILLYPPG